MPCLRIEKYPSTVLVCSCLMTDEHGGYVAVGREFGGPGTVNHGIEEAKAGLACSSAGPLANISTRILRDRGNVDLLCG